MKRELNREGDLLTYADEDGHPSRPPHACDERLSEIS